MVSELEKNGSISKETMLAARAMYFAFL